MRSFIKGCCQFIICWTWAIVQTLAGFVVFIYSHLFSPNECTTHMHRGQPFTHIPGCWGGLSLGWFTFVDDQYLREYSENIVDHEYGHVIQSMIFGPLWIFIFGIPSLIWAGFFKNWRIKHCKSYYWFYTERFADYLGGVTRRKI